MGNASRVPAERLEVVRASWPARALLVHEPLVRTGVAEVLRDSGCKVTEAPNGAQACDLLASGPAMNLLISDYLVPGMTGAVFVARLRRERPGLPSLLITGCADAEVITLMGGGLARIAKPFSQAQLGVGVAEVRRDRTGPRDANGPALRVIEGSRQASRPGPLGDGRSQSEGECAPPAIQGHMIFLIVISPTHQPGVVAQPRGSTLR